jgi:hypothetical protein
MEWIINSWQHYGCILCSLLGDRPNSLSFQWFLYIQLYRALTLVYDSVTKYLFFFGSPKRKKEEIVSVNLYTLLYDFFWVIPRCLNFICHFITHCSIFIDRQVCVEWTSSFHAHLPAYEDGTDSVPKRQHIKFRRRGITQKKSYNIQNTAKVWNQECVYTFVATEVYDVCFGAFWAPSSVLSVPVFYIVLVKKYWFTRHCSVSTIWTNQRTGIANLKQTYHSLNAIVAQLKTCPFEANSAIELKNYNSYIQQ